MTSGAQDLSIRQLQYVVALADTLGFHRAARRCGVSQPTLSSQLQKLEEVLGVRIFERDRRRVLVTPAGAGVIERARGILLDIDDLLTTAAESADPFTGTLRVGVIPTIAPYLLPWVTPAIAERWPQLRLALVEEKTPDVLAGLRDGSLDAGLLADVRGMEDLDKALVLDDPFVVALPPKHPLAKKKTIALADLDAALVLLLEDGHCLRDQALALCARAGAKETDLRATSLSTLVQMVSAGAGITLLPQIAVGVENRRGQLVLRPLTGRDRGRTLSLAWRKAAPLGPALRELAKTMSIAAKKALPRAGHA